MKYRTTETDKQERLSLTEKNILKVIGTSVKTMEDIYQEMKNLNSENSLTDVMENVLNLQIKRKIKGENGYYFRTGVFEFHD